ncbi:sulfite exporter TauE/SafE family protein [Massilia glaciei]|uniref:Probable membrane transporter protein n=1 Tax=Massilia glaciei TaxID=1524097 RepID=A0A2U2H8Z5_9BURK|nr:sulfite exporter TauE/SafE family protein [Massilia glaciei]PWF39046.1 sulfite exporter TauE/SafE family protein [Massilia glaciei]
MLTALGLGLVVGVILALTGAGGGILAVPLLVFGIGMGVAEAGPIGLLAVGMAAALGAVLGLREGIVRYRAAMLIAGSGMLLSPLGLWLAHRIDNRWLSVLFALILLLVAFRTLRQPRRPAPPPAAGGPAPQPCQRGGSGRFVWTSACARALVLSGTVAGLLSGLLGVGGGFVMVPALQRYTDLAMRSVVATSLAVIALVSVTGVAASAASGGMAWPVALPFAAGALAGMLGGRMLSARLAGPQLQIGFALVSAAVGVGMIVKSVL